MSNMEEIEIDLSALSRDELLFIITEMHNRRMTFNEFVVYVLSELVERNKE